MRIVVALGGNALLKRGEPPEADTQRKNVEKAAVSIAEVATIHQVILTHGNGPQIGLLALEAEAYRDVDPYPFHLLGAESQGMIGYLLIESLGNLMPGSHISALMTRVLVDADDPAFDSPSKPIGPVYEEKEAKRLSQKRGFAVAADGAFWRRVVPSPAPKEIVDLAEIRLLADAGFIVICAGGGGVPVVAQNGGFKGVEAVIDKDRTSSLLATGVDAEMLLILTDVSAVAEGFESGRPRWIRRAPPRALRSEDFAPGSMAPKIEAVCRFVEETGKPAVIGRLDAARALMEGSAGTRIEAGRAAIDYYESEPS